MLESLPAGDYKLSIQAFYTEDNCKNSSPIVSDPTEVSGILVWKPLQEVISATVNNGAFAYLKPGEKFDLHFTLKNNRGGSDIHAGVDRIEWLIANQPPTPTSENHAPGMTCAEPSPRAVDFARTYSSALLKTASTAAAVPTNMSFGTYNLYLRVFEYATSNCSTSYAISPVFVLENAIRVVPGVYYIQLKPDRPKPQPPLTVGKSPVRISWEVKFSYGVTGVDASDFSLFTPGLSKSASIVDVSGSSGGDTYVVTAEIPAGSIEPDQLASVRLDFVDNDSVQTKDQPNQKVGGPGIGNGNATGETQLLEGTICAAANVIWCDDFERSTQGGKHENLVGNGWVASTGGSCSNVPTGSSHQPDAGGCAGIDSDIKPYQNYANPRANKSRSMFNRWSAHTVTSEVIDLSNLPAGSEVEYSYWLRRGDNVFAEVPEFNTDYFKAEYLDNTSTWQLLAVHRSTGGDAVLGGAVAGEVMRLVFQLPRAALWNGFRLRFTQNRGDGSSGTHGSNNVNGYDYWFVDDVVLRRVEMPRYSGGFCDNFEAPEASRKQWSFSYEDVGTGATPPTGNDPSVDTSFRAGDAGITGDVYPSSGSPTHSMFLRWSYIVASSLRIDTSAMSSGVPVSYIMQRGLKPIPKTINGSNLSLLTCNFSTAQPGNGFASEYFGADNNWHRLDYVDGIGGSDNCGEQLPYTKTITDSNAQHKNFRLRFRQISKGASGEGQTLIYNYDYWLVDNVCIGRTLTQGLPKSDLELTKTRKTGEKLLPGSVVTYVLQATNKGPDPMRGNLQIVDTLPAGMSFHTFRGEDWFCEVAEQVATCAWSGELAKDQKAPDLYIYAVVAETANGVLMNKATLSSGAVLDETPGNNDATDTGEVETIFFLFTKGECKVGSLVGGVDSAAACSRYDFGGLAGELKSGIHLTHMDATGKRASALSDSEDTSMRMEFALHCLDPAQAPPAPVQAIFGAEAAQLLTLATCAGKGASSMNWSTVLNVTLEKGKATVSGSYGFRYGDVGMLELHARADGDNTKQGDSGAFVQRPAALVLKDVVCADDTLNPGAAEANGASFCRAGQPFGLTVEAQSVDGSPTPNFGREDAPKGIFLEKSLVLPQNGHNPDLGLRGLGDFTNGVATTTEQSWAEVGIIAITPRLGDTGDGGMVLSDRYLGAGDVPPEGLQSVTIGRFYPGHFQTLVGSEGRMECPSGMSCPEGGFFYTGQPFALSVKACLHGDEGCVGQLENYSRDFAATVNLSAWGARGANEADRKNPPPGKGGYLQRVGLDLKDTTITRTEFDGGRFTDQFTYEHDTANRAQPVAPFDVYIRAEEDGRDGVSSRFSATPNSSPEGGLKLARGRLQLSNSFGPAKNALTIPVQVQFWFCLGDGQCDWTASATDTTRIEPASALEDAGKRAALSVSLHPVQGIDTDTMPEVERLELSGGTGRIVLLPKGGTGSLNVGINLGYSAEDNACDHTAGGREGAAANLPWLRAWNGTCAQAQTGEADPSARATFGTYSGERRRSVHSRELY
ncbi:MAG: DUF11 domain-containing protein [Azoarcus sp.]|nr:DUF11 domain-containing protein [Azoarcus sp.]